MLSLSHRKLLLNIACWRVISWLGYVQTTVPRLKFACTKIIIWKYTDSRWARWAGSPGGAHHGGATHSSDTAVDGGVLRFVWGLHTNLSTTASAILPSPLWTAAQYIVVIYIAVAYPPHLCLPHVAVTLPPHYSALCHMNRRLW